MSLSIAGIVLAGGLSRRMGGVNKATQTLAGKTLLNRAIEQLSKQTPHIAVNANHPDIIVDNLPIIQDTIEGFLGPLAGVLAGLDWAKSLNHTHIVTVATDTPFFPSDLLDRFLDANKGAMRHIVLAGSGGYRHPVFGLWPVSLAEDLRQWFETTDTNKVLAFVHQHEWTMAEFDPIIWGEETLDPFFNINTPEDLLRAETLLKANPL